MQYFYSPSEQKCFVDVVHKKDMPNDCFEISNEQFADICTARDTEQEYILIVGEQSYIVCSTPPEPPEPTYAELREAAILEKWSMSAQLEALTEAAEDPPRPEKMNQLLADIQAIKELYPKPDES